jgi:hypothetical protein
MTWRMVFMIALATALVAAGLYGTSQADARKATREERVGMLQALRASNEGFRAEPRRCWSVGFLTRVARARPRTGVIWMNTRVRAQRRCLVGDGYVIVRRRTPKATRWRIAWQGSGEIPCRWITSKMARELKLGRRCGIFY